MWKYIYRMATVHFKNLHLCPITTSDKHVAHYGWATLLISYYSPIILSFTFVTAASIIPSDGKKKTSERDQINTCGLIPAHIII